MTQQEKALDKQDAAEVKNYTRVPNMLIFGYHDELSPQEKWLYVCLKHLCGKAGTHHLSLRYIAEQTGISVGALSKSQKSEGMIKHLHDAGLIHAEIKKFQGRGNPQYHITITDVWGLNQMYFETCPNSEQACPKNEQVDDEPVRILNKPVRISDAIAPTCPNSEQACPNFDTILRLDTRLDSRKITEQEREDASSADDGAAAPIKALAKTTKDATKPPRASSKHRERSGPDPTPAEAIAIMNTWDSLFKHPYPRTDKHIEAAILLIPFHPDRDDLKAVKGFIFQSNPWYKDKGVTLLDVAKNIGKWQSLQELAVPETVRTGGVGTVSGRQRFVVPDEALAAMAGRGGGGGGR